jgi:hypothetical protein
MKRKSCNYEESPWEHLTVEISKLEQSDMHPLCCPVFVLEWRFQEGTYYPKCTTRAEQKVYIGHLHHYSRSVPMIWYPKTKLASPRFYVISDIHPDSLCLEIETCTESIKTDYTADETSLTSETTSIYSTGARSIMSIKYI